SFDELERRLVSRGSETPETIAGRLAQGRRELAQARYYDHSIINDDLNRAAEEFVALMRNS
ncbi:MAG: guanylate kinase, partial [Candidatus Saccharibacteria bacterium]